MQRRNFIKLSTGATLGLGLAAQGMPKALLDFLTPITNCSDVSDRVLVVVRLAGANDGLNTIIPYNQYGTYAALRPTIKLNQTGTGAMINLDTTLAGANQLGIHPSMTGFKSLYDSGKLSVINSVGYPSPNYSHFTSENLMFSGKDGTTSDTIDYGFWGRYIDSVFPGMTNNPQPFLLDPLALHFGSTNPSLGFTHTHGTSEYNVTSLQDTFNTQLAATSIPLVSEYNDNLSFIKTIESAMDGYYNRVLSVFNSGSNSTTSYPNTDLARQLKTVARMLKGGSKTKIFQTTLGGFDNHANQVVAGATHTGTHANLLQNVSDSIKSFMNDLAILGLEDKVMVVTFSEFGRTVTQNNSTGTDHGDLSPMFVIGKHVNPGVVGVPANLSNVSGSRFLQSERQFDYRQVYTTLLQDWLGADNTVLADAQLDAFQPQKLNLVAGAQNAYPSCLAANLLCSYNPAIERQVYLVAQDNGWNYYSYSLGTPTNYEFGIELNPTGAGANTNTIELDIKITTMECNADGTQTFVKQVGDEAMFAAGSYCNTKVLSAIQPNGFVNIRWFVEDVYPTNLNTVASDFATAHPAAAVSPIMYLKKMNSKLALPTNFRADALGIYYAVEPLTVAGTGTINTRNYIQFNNVERINGTGFGAFKRASALNGTNAVYDIPAAIPSQSGSLRYNTVTNTFEGYNGQDWNPLH